MKLGRTPTQKKRRRRRTRKSLVCVKKEHHIGKKEVEQEISQGSHSHSCSASAAAKAKHLAVRKERDQVSGCSLD